jgi:hypothetical protein
MVERIVLVHNPTSTRADDIARCVVAPLQNEHIPYTDYPTKYADSEHNIDDMRSIFQDGDTLLCAGGDGTVMQVANAVLRNNHLNTRVGYLAYGNFNDLAGRTRNPLELLNPAAQIAERYPLTITVDGRYWRDAPGYMTIGFTAVAASRFAHPEVREHMKRAPEWAKLAASIGRLGITYFHDRRTFLPPFSTNESPIVHHAVTDIIALNNRHAGRIIRSETDYGTAATFGYHTADVSTIAKNIPFGLRALSGHAPLAPLSHLAIDFQTPASLPIQTEGEFAELTDVTRICIYKDPAKVLRVLRAAQN